uniref:DUF659 domain-containing protein n=1 Tax=Lactuca sativa TaxID=4236 RepID=A0A9R1VSF7_LACSA|nr:hypothetical protein LSAT_V11C400203290 [Lactuca sativa]
MVNSVKGSVFVMSIDVLDVSKDADLLFHVLDKTVEEVGEQNVVQVVTDNASTYVKAVVGSQKRASLLDTMCCSLIGFDVVRHWKKVLNVKITIKRRCYQFSIYILMFLL